MGYVELTIIPNYSTLQEIPLNAKQCIIHSATINDADIPFKYSEIPSSDPDFKFGELLVTLPDDLKCSNTFMNGFKIRISFSIHEPKCGIQFINSNDANNAYMFTHGHMARLWFPCIDSYSVACPWTLEYYLDENLTVVSSGERYKTNYRSELNKIATHFKIRRATPAYNIAIAIGRLVVYRENHSSTAINYCTNINLPFVADNAKWIYCIIQFFKLNLQHDYPHSRYHQVFVDQVDENFYSYSSVSLFNVRFLQTSRLIENSYTIRKILAEAYARQFYGCYTLFNNWSNLWLDYGIAKYLSLQYIRSRFGIKEYKHEVLLEHSAVVNFEKQSGGLVLNIWDPNDESTPYSPHLTCIPLKKFCIPSHKYIEVAKRKSYLVIRMIQKFIGTANLIDIFRMQLKQVTFISTSKIILDILRHTGKDVDFMAKNWLRNGGHPLFYSRYTYNKQLNVLHLYIAQKYPPDKGYRVYFGPLTVRVQEVSGSYDYQLSINSENTIFTVKCHAFQNNNNSIINVPLFNDETVKVDLKEMRGADCPVLWLRLDPEICIIRDLKMEQQPHQWYYQLLHDPDIIAKNDALISLTCVIEESTIRVLNTVIQDENYYYSTRTTAILVLNKVLSSKNRTFGEDVIEKFRALINKNSINYNNFERFLYEKIFPFLIRHRKISGTFCPPEFIPIIIKALQNSERMTKTYVPTAALVNILCETIIPFHSDTHRNGYKILDEINRILSNECRSPSILQKHFLITSCLRCLRKLQQSHHLDQYSYIFKSYTENFHHVEVRLGAYECIIDLFGDYYKGEINEIEDLVFVFSAIDNDPDPTIRNGIVKNLIAMPFLSSQNKYCEISFSLINTLWETINENRANDAKLKQILMDFYFISYNIAERNNVPTTSQYVSHPMCVNAQNNDETTDQNVMQTEVVEDIANPNLPASQVVETDKNPTEKSETLPSLRKIIDIYPEFFGPQKSVESVDSEMLSDSETFKVHSEPETFVYRIEVVNERDKDTNMVYKSISQILSEIDIFKTVINPLIPETPAKFNSIIEIFLGSEMETESRDEIPDVAKLFSYPKTWNKDCAKNNQESIAAKILSKMVEYKVSHKGSVRNIQKNVMESNLSETVLNALKATHSEVCNKDSVQTNRENAGRKVEPIILKRIVSHEETVNKTYVKDKGKWNVKDKGKSGKSSKDKNLSQSFKVPKSPTKAKHQKVEKKNLQHIMEGLVYNVVHLEDLNKCSVKLAQKKVKKDKDISVGLDKLPTFSIAETVVKSINVPKNPSTIKDLNETKYPEFINLVDSVENAIVQKFPTYEMEIIEENPTRSSSSNSEEEL